MRCRDERLPSNRTNRKRATSAVLRASVPWCATIVPMALVSRLEQLRSVGHRAKGLVSIVGNIAAGKSTVIEQLSRVVAVEPEPIDIWWPFLEDMRVSVSIYTA